MEKLEILSRLTAIRRKAESEGRSLSEKEGREAVDLMASFEKKSLLEELAVMVLLLNILGQRAQQEWWDGL